MRNGNSQVQRPQRRGSHARGQGNVVRVARRAAREAVVRAGLLTRFIPTERLSDGLSDVDDQKHRDMIVTKDFTGRKDGQGSMIVVPGDGAVTVRRILPLRWSYDDRIDDGLNARFGLSAIQRILENPFEEFGGISASTTDNAPSELTPTQAEPVKPHG